MFEITMIKMGICCLALVLVIIYLTNWMQLPIENVPPYDIYKL